MEFKYLLLLRYLLVNVIGIAISVAAYFQGWIELVLDADITYFCVGIFGVFLVGLVACTSRTWSVSREINSVRTHGLPAPNSRAEQYIRQISHTDSGSRANIAAAMRHRLFSRITHIRQIANTLVVLGLIGTVIGFIIALSGVDPDIATNPGAVSPMVAKLIEGMSVALYTTLVGSILSVWLTSCYQILATGTTTLFSAIVELGERSVVG